jgi:two-component system, NtrC family, response regulator HupR/HoxA
VVDLRPYAQLHTVLLLKDLIRRWYQVELAFADARGWVMDHADGQVIPPGNDFCRFALFSKEGFRRCNESVKEVVVKLRLSGRQRRSVVHACHLGFDVVAAPLVLDGELAGFVFVSGGVHADVAPERRAELTSILRQIAAPDDLEQRPPSVIPRLGEGDLSHLQDLLELAAREVEAHHAERRQEERRHGAARTSAALRFDGVVGTSRTMRETVRLLEKVAASDATVLIQGESGTGKELVARAVHEGGDRATRPFVVQNCSALHDNLLESALFGHAKGSFTGAVRDKKGLFEIADGGTFFLDEVGDMSPALQVKLLRVLQEGAFTPVGATELRQVDVRVIAATHKDLQAMVDRGEFREDLFYRINVIRVQVPALRERLDDLDLLVEHFVRKHFRGKGRPPQLGPDVRLAFQRYGWPGNIRELENEIERLLVLGKDQTVVTAELLSPRIRQPDGSPRLPRSTPDPSSGTLRDILESVEREMIHQGLIRTHWNKSQLAKELGISRSNLIQKCTYYGLEKD